MLKSVARPIRIVIQLSLVLACLAALQQAYSASDPAAPVASTRVSAAARPDPRPEAPAPAAALPQAPAPTLASAASGTNFAVLSVLRPERALQAGEYLWDDEGVAEGPLRIVVDLEAQQLYVYRAGVEIGRSFILYGADDKPTPTGTFPILEKKVHHVSNLYFVPMPYMMRLTMDGIALHASEVEDGYATHGCIGLPDEFAQLIFREAKIGDQVVITTGWPHHHAAEDAAETV